jgi:hypothetical protein
VKLLEQDIQEFVEAWKSDFGETLSKESAESEALRLIDFFAWMHEEISCPGGHEDIEDVVRDAWKKTLERGHDIDT